jgi:hypothetical protein
LSNDVLAEKKTDGGLNETLRFMGRPAQILYLRKDCKLANPNRTLKKIKE